MVDSSRAKTALESWSSLSEKTVFILDRATYFTQVSSGYPIEGDVLDEAKRASHVYASQPAIKPFDRSLWTCTVEAVVGYCRLVWDLFTPDQRCISIISAGPYKDDEKVPEVMEKITTWQEQDQNMDNLYKQLGKMSYVHQVVPPKRLISTNNISSLPNCGVNSASMIKSLEQALLDLSLQTTSQTERETKIKPTPIEIPKQRSYSPTENNGRIILISSFQSQEAIDELIKVFEIKIKERNDAVKEALKLAPEGLRLAPINYCDLVLVNTFPIKDDGPCSSIPESSSFRPNMHCKTYSVRSGRNIAGLLNNLCLQHNNLKSTTITGIPMKEEQSTKSSSQYDVEIVHCSSVHEDILSTTSPLLKDVVEIIDRNGFPCDTFKLSWCTPRSTSVELNHCTATSRMTSVDVNSRPSACLINFLLSGRTVMLEVFKSKNFRMTTHFLTSHNGELYIHSLPTQQSKSISQDIPPMIEALGGRVQDYRLNDFINFMKQHTLSRCYINDDPANRTSKLIKRQTLYWPLTVGHTILLINPVNRILDKLIQAYPKECLNQSDIDESKVCIDQLIKYEKDNAALPSVSIIDIIKSTNTNAKGAGSKLAQLYKLLWNELEYFLRVYATSPEHETIMEYLLDRRNKRSGEGGSDKANKRSASKAVANIQSPGPMKKPKLSQQVIPEVDMTNPLVQLNLPLFKTGVSVWQCWARLYDQYHRSRAKQTFIGRSRPPKTLQSQNTIATVIPPE